MNAGRFQDVYANLNHSLKKVFDVTPISEPWTVQQIIAELSRKGCAINHYRTSGCLGQLVELGLVIETEPRKFIRVKVKDKKLREPHHQQENDMQENHQEATMPTPTPATITSIPTLPREESLLDTLAALAVRARQLADDIDSAALRASAQIENASADTRKLRQLQEILRGLA